MSPETNPVRSTPHIVVIGAGVIGLQTALALLDAGYKTTIIAEHGPDDRAAAYTSPCYDPLISTQNNVRRAGAQWRTHAGDDEPELQGWDAITYREWMGLAEEEERNGTGTSGLGIYPSFLYWATSAPAEIWWQNTVSAFTPLPTSALPANTQAGVRFTSLTVNAPLYLHHLLSSLRRRGGTLLKARLPTQGGFAAALDVASALVAREEGGEEVAAFVNAAGLGAGELAGDEKVFPTRGQTVLVRGEAEAIRTWEGEGRIHYVLPRKGAAETVLGGTKEAGNWNTAVDDNTTQTILQACKTLAPELLNQDQDFEVLTVQVGLRPSRQGGPRVEPEVVGGRYIVVHSYGHSGAGYQNSVGSARKVLRLLDELDVRPGVLAQR